MKTLVASHEQSQILRFRDGIVVEIWTQHHFERPLIGFAKIAGSGQTKLIARWAEHEDKDCWKVVNKLKRYSLLLKKPKSANLNHNSGTLKM
ncbi:hypothetical protein RRG08_052782 [Elysia crispata]|uniref:Uncharacterized protein n=1 Tax=Elysia crispata TaxID=231223 RepID=A0AAE1EAG5_9GAST|nr:hypothetical protein RRG08_052782 [Elysia crispata]